MRQASSMSLAVAASLAILAYPGQPALADECRMVSVDQVTAAFPQYSRWTLHSGGAGGCRFEGQGRDSAGLKTSLNYARLSLTQQFHPSKKAASEVMETFRAGYAKSYTLNRINLRGAEPGAFICSKTAKGEPVNGLMWQVQVGRAILSGSFGPPAEEKLTDADEGAAISLLQIAVADTASSATAETAVQCPHFDATLIRKLIPGKSVTIEQFGEDSCMAKNELNATVMVSRTRNLNAATVAQMAQATAGACTFDPLPMLGEHGRIGYRCTLGQKRAEVSFYKDQAYYKFDVVPNGEPTEQQRADLVELARKRYAR